MSKRLVLVTGATGFIGKHVVGYLRECGCSIRIVSTDLSHVKAALPNESDVFVWKAPDYRIERKVIDDVEMIIHLAGESIFSFPWTEHKKQMMITSRVNTTLSLLSQILETKTRVKTFIQASAVGIYGNDQENQKLDEGATIGQGFLPQVCRLWELGSQLLERSDIQTVVLRNGIVLGSSGGALPKLEQTRKLHIGLNLKEKKWLSWIHIEDLMRVIDFTVHNSKITGAINCVAPNASTYEDLYNILDQHHGKTQFIPELSSGFVKKLTGDMSEVILANQRCIPAKLLKQGFTFQFESIEAALADIFSNNKESLSA